LNIGGMASGRGITFTSGNRQVRVTSNGKGSLQFKSRATVSSPLAGRASKVPFLRGLLAFGRIRVMPLLLLVALLADFGLLFGGEQAGAAEDIAGWAALGLLAILVLVRLFFLRDVLRYHAAEHMAINTVEAGKELTVENIASASRTHPRCGTMLAIYVVCVAAPCAVFIPYVSLALLITASFSYELFLNAPGVPALKWLSAFGLWLQKAITTAPPDQKHIEAARQGLLKLLEQNL
jgi:uncharacterized protein YqhQ